MKKKIIILISALAVLTLFVPVPRTHNDGGTKTYQALVYEVVKWHKVIDEEHVFTDKEVYWFPNNFKSIDKLWNGIQVEWATPLLEDMADITETGLVKFVATALEVNEGSLLVEPVDGCAEFNSSDKLYIPTKLSNGSIVTDVNVGDRIEVTYDGNIAETYPAQINMVYDIRKNGVESDVKVTVSFLDSKTEHEIDQEDAVMVSELINAQTNWTFSYDNISNILLKVNGTSYYYDSSSGILTESDDRAIKLSDKDKNELDSAIKLYLYGAEETTEMKTTGVTVDSTKPKTDDKTEATTDGAITIVWLR